MYGLLGVASLSGQKVAQLFMMTSTCSSNQRSCCTDSNPGIYLVALFSLKEPSSDESGLETKPLSPKRRRLRSVEEFKSHGYASLTATVPLIRSTRQSAR